LVVVYGLAFSVPFAADHWSEWVAQNAGGKVETGPRWDPSSPSFWYQRIVTLGFRAARPHYTSLLVFGPDDIPDGPVSAACSRRAFLAKLVRAASAYRPSEIVIDKHFEPGTCGDAETNRLLVDAVVSADSPVVIVGAFESTIAEARVDHPTAAVAAAKYAEIDPLLVFPDLFPDSAEPRRGLVRLNQDVRKIPTWWTAWAPYRPSEAPQSMMSLAMMTAVVHDPWLRSTSRWKRMQRLHPYTAFIDEKDFPTVGARKLLDSKPTLGSLEEALRHRILLIAEHSSTDIHSTLGSEVSGYVLQANYIEGLLDDRVVFPFPSGIDIGLGIAWCLVLQTIFWRCERSPLKAVLWATTFIALGVVAIYLTATLAGYYTRAWPGSLIAVAFKALETKANGLKNKLKGAVA
jgi:hypothetical protein